MNVRQGIRVIETLAIPGVLFDSHEEATPFRRGGLYARFAAEDLSGDECATVRDITERAMSYKPENEMDTRFIMTEEFALGAAIFAYAAGKGEV